MRVLRAKSRAEVLDELRGWAKAQRAHDPRLIRVGLFGSYARDCYAPGSDLDLLLIVRDSDEPRWFMRASAFDTSALSVGPDLFVYTEAEASRLEQSSPWFRHILREVVWIE